MHPKILIVAPVPYRRSLMSRSYESYFANWEHENLAQFFSSPQTPVKGHCGTLFQITDAQIIRSMTKRKNKVGKIFFYDDLPFEKDTVIGPKDKNKVLQKLYKMGSRKNYFYRMMRKILWRKKYWCTPEFNEWLEAFSPECVFMYASDDYFIPQIALYAAEKFNIPIISAIGDDHYFNDKFSLNPLYYLYRGMYHRLIDKVFRHGGSAVYISDKIRDKYNSEFSINGKTIYLSSESETRDFKTINKTNPLICYFGNIRQGRNESLSAIASALGKINKDYMVNVYSGQNDKDIVKVLTDNKNIRFMGVIPYSEVLETIKKADVLIIVEGFKHKHVVVTRYSLSTKVADSLQSGVPVLAYGSDECAVINYLRDNDCAAVCSDNNELEKTIRNLLTDEEYQKRLYNNALEIIRKNHNLEKSNKIFEDLVDEVICDYKKD